MGNFLDVCWGICGEVNDVEKLFVVMIFNFIVEVDLVLFEVFGGSLGWKEFLGEVCIVFVFGEKYEEEVSVCVLVNVFFGLVGVKILLYVEYFILF